MSVIAHRLAHLPLYYFSNRFRLGVEARDATRFWAAMDDFAQYYEDPVAQGRSRWLCNDVLAGLELGSLLEVGCNSGRNLAFASEILPSVRLKGIDVNSNAIAYARKRNPHIVYDVADANAWKEPGKSCDAILTMSVLDHIPDEVLQVLAQNFTNTAKKYIVCVELWDGSDGRRGWYKYSRDLRKVFGRFGITTVRWEKASGQYDERASRLFLYVGRVS
jgi:SAM-dependent methyltransferase